jgi:hypothetical protein
MGTSKQGIQTREMFLPDRKCEADEDEARKPLADSEFVAYKAMVRILANRM